MERYVFGVICMLVVMSPVFLLFLFFLSVILRGACALLGAKEPTIAAGMKMVFVASLISALINLALGFTILSILSGGRFDDPPSLPTEVVLGLLGTVVNMTVPARLYSQKIPGVSFGKGILIYWIQTLIFLFILGVIVGGVVLAIVITG
jgi:hypothetical protein